MVTKTVYVTREEWLAARNEKPVLGSSDVGTIMGLNPYHTPYQYWLAQKSLKDIDETNDNLYRGQFKEDAIAKMFAHKTGEKIIQSSAEITVYRNSKFPEYVQVAPDRELFAKGRGDRLVLECKDTKLHIPELTAEYMPKSWFVQIQYQMGVMERQQAYIACEEGHKNLAYGLFDFNTELFRDICSYCFEWFERYILGDEVPPLETGEDVKLAFPISTPTTKVVDRSIFELTELLREKRKIAKVLDQKIKEMEDELRVAFLENEAIEFEGVTLATYKTVITNRIDTKALEEAHPELAAQFRKESITRTLKLK